MQRRLKKSVVYSLYLVAFLLLLGGIVFLEMNTNNHLSDSKDEHQFVSKTGVTKKKKDIPVVSTESNTEEKNDTEKEGAVKIIRPYSDSDIKVLKKFYDMNASEDDQKNSLLYYENTYIPSSGVSYGKESEFDVISILDGKVISVKEDDTLGNVITIEHSNGIISTYESVKDITVKEGNEVKQGDKIATSSTSNISRDLNNHLYFELTVNNKIVNPEEYYDKNIEDIGA